MVRASWKFLKLKKEVYVRSDTKIKHILVIIVRCLCVFEKYKLIFVQKAIGNVCKIWDEEKLCIG